MEEWRPIQTWEGLYEISNFGRVRSITREYIGKTPQGKPCKRVAYGKLLKPVIKSIWGYVGVNLYKGSRRETFYIHRLVALAFIPNPDDKPEIDHIDRDKRNNHKLNLRWATAKENSSNRNPK